MKIFFLGDLHGNSTFGCMAIRRASELGCERIIQLGDFGFWPGKSGDDYLHSLEVELSRQDVQMYVVRGNHDDPHRWQNYELNDEGFGMVSDHLFYIPDGSRFTWDNVEFGALGGASSIYRQWRQDRFARGLDKECLWWSEEMVNLDAAASMVVTKLDGTPLGLDVLLTHEGPSWSPTAYDRVSRHFTMYDQARSAVCRGLVDFVAEATRPWAHFHGHHHQRGVGYAPWDVRRGRKNGDKLRRSPLKRETGLVYALAADVNNSVTDATHVLDLEVDAPPIAEFEDD